MLTVLHDLHLGANRSAGTTVNSKVALRARMQAQFRELLSGIDTDLMILGDLYDTFDINPVDIVQSYFAFSTWLTMNPTKKLYLVPGNHDLSKTSSTLSSFAMLGEFLSASHSMQVIRMDKPGMTPYGYVIPHLPNQALFDEALLEVPECDVLFLHVNYDNKFAARSDQSLNLTAEQAAACKAQRILIAHEHNSRTTGKIVIPGNQIASSVSDWLHSPFKFYAQVSGSTITLVNCRARTNEYVEINWKELDGHPATSFIRVTGTATAEEATIAVTTLAKYRASSPALVISSAIEMQTTDDTEAFSSSLESAQSFDVWRALEEHLTTDQLTKVKALT
jgi:metallophosphoesterase superfamily enzyme